MWVATVGVPAGVERAIEPDWRPMRPALRWTSVCIDCADAGLLADFYCRLLGWQVTARDGEGWVQAGDPDGGIGLNFQSEDWYRPPTWPEQPEEQTKMMHFEILVDDLEAAVAHAIAAGATVAPDQPPDRDPNGLRVMLDPAGHPFCLFVEGE
jgi:catechol 2,3-dioxygenase-like lactoylglutathione lyase family enzyme